MSLEQSGQCASCAATLFCVTASSIHVYVCPDCNDVVGVYPFMGEVDPVPPEEFVSGFVEDIARCNVDSVECWMTIVVSAFPCCTCEKGQEE